jgi:hypothetical protein
MGISNIQISALFAVLLFFTFIIRSILKGNLRTEYSIVWLLMGGVFLIFSVWRNLLEILAKFFEVYYAPSLIFMFLFFMIFIFLIHLSIVNSKQHEQIKKLAQEIALLKNKKNS